MTDDTLQETANLLAEGTERVRRAPPGVLVIFGASGDLTARKLLPAIEALARRRLLPAAFSVIGVARSEWDDDEFRKVALDSCKDAGPGWAELVKHFRYIAGDYASPDTFTKLKDVLAELDRERGTSGNRTYYMATVPSVFGLVGESLKVVGLHDAEPGQGNVRVVVEKPYGVDLPSMLKLDGEMHAVFREEQIYRIDHYLGKETVQNVLALRFANAIFEPIWNQHYLDHVQITVAESLGVGHRGGFYEGAGAMRDIVQNHVAQVLALTLMEPPSTIDAKGIRDEKVKALRAVEIMDEDQVLNEVVRAQYGKGWVEGEEVNGYREEEGVDPQSRTETFMAMRLKVDNWRWAGVPIYIRTGKRLPKRLTEVALQFKSVPHLAFGKKDVRGLHPNALVLRIQPDDGITLRFGAKVPGQAFEVRDVLMDFSYGAAFMEEAPEAYERLLLDAMVGDPTLFIRTDEVEQAWRIVDPIQKAWADPTVGVASYKAGSWGPKEADRLIERDGRSWRSP